MKHLDTRWRDKGVWQLIFETLMQQVGLQEDLEWVMIDATFIKCHMSACGAKGENQEIAKSKEAQYKNTYSS